MTSAGASVDSFITEVYGANAALGAASAEMLNASARLEVFGAGLAGIGAEAEAAFLSLSGNIVEIGAAFTGLDAELAVTDEGFLALSASIEELNAVFMTADASLATTNAELLSMDVALGVAGGSAVAFGASLDAVDKKLKATEVLAVALPGILIGIGAGWATEQAAGFQDAATTLTSLTGSADEAKAHFEWMKNFSMVTPFRFEDLVDADIQLKNIGIDGRQAIEGLADAASAKNTTINQAVTAFTAGIADNFKSLRQYGVYAISISNTNVDELQNMYGKALRVGDEALQYQDKQGKWHLEQVDKLNKAEIASTLEAIMNDKYSGAVQARAQTFSGLMSTLQDNLQIAAASAMGEDMDNMSTSSTGLLSALQGLEKGAIGTLTAFNNLSPGTKTLIGDMILGVGAISLIAAGLLVMPVIVGAVGGAFAAATGETLTFGVALSTAIWPATLIVGSLVLAGAILYELNEKTGLVSDAITVFSDVLQLAYFYTVQFISYVGGTAINVINELIQGVNDLTGSAFTKIGESLDSVHSSVSSFDEYTKSIVGGNEQVSGSTQNAASTVGSATSSMSGAVSGLGSEYNNTANGIVDANGQIGDSAESAASKTKSAFDSMLASMDRSSQLNALYGYPDSSGGSSGSSGMSGDAMLSQYKNLDSLKSQLAGLKDQYDSMDSSSGSGASKSATANDSILKSLKAQLEVYRDQDSALSAIHTIEGDRNTLAYDTKHIQMENQLDTYKEQLKKLEENYTTVGSPEDLQKLALQSKIDSLQDNIKKAEDDRKLENDRIALDYDLKKEALKKKEDSVSDKISDRESTLSAASASSSASKKTDDTAKKALKDQIDELQKKIQDTEDNLKAVQTEKSMSMGDLEKSPVQLQNNQAIGIDSKTGLPELITMTRDADGKLKTVTNDLRDLNVGYHQFVDSNGKLFEVVVNDGSITQKEYDKLKKTVTDNGGRIIEVQKSVSIATDDTTKSTDKLNKSVDTTASKSLAPVKAQVDTVTYSLNDATDSSGNVVTGMDFINAADLTGITGQFENGLLQGMLGVVDQGDILTIALAGIDNFSLDKITKRFSDLGNAIGNAVNGALNFVGLGGDSGSSSSSSSNNYSYSSPSNAGGVTTAQYNNQWGADVGMATGGIVTKPTHKLVGEAGPEAVIPLSKLKDLFGMGPGGNIHIGTINNNGESLNALKTTLAILGGG